MKRLQESALLVTHPLKGLKNPTQGEQSLMDPGPKKIDGNSLTNYSPSMSRPKKSSLVRTKKVDVTKKNWKR